MANAKVNEKTDGANGYIALYKGKQAEVWAKTSYDAQQLAAKFFKAKKSYDVSVHLCERADGTEVLQTITN